MTTNPNPPSRGATLDVAKFGVPATVAADASPSIQSLLDGSADVVCRFGDGQRYLGRPLVVTGDGVSFVGSGRRVCGFQPNFRGPSVIVGPLGDRAADGFSFSSAGRPDLYGLADASLAPGPGQAVGFDTLGRTVLYLAHNAATLGGWADGGWDYWSGPGGCTVEFLVAGKFAAGDPVMGCGSAEDPAGPGVVTVASDTPNAVKWFLSFEGVPGSHAVTFPGVDWSGPVRLRLWFDPASGQVGAWANGKDLGPGQWYGPAPDLAGARLRSNDRGYPFQVGQYGKVALELGAYVPSFRLGGLCLSNVAFKADAGTDARRYAKQGPGVVLGLSTASATRDAGRVVWFREGYAAGGWPCYALALDARANGSPVADFAARDVHVSGGGFLLAQTFDPTFTDVSAEGGTVGLASLRYGCNYTARESNCRWSGTDCAVDMFATIGVSTGVDWSGGGVTSCRQTGSQYTRSGTLAYGFGPRPRSGCDLFEGQYGGLETHAGVVFNNEGVAFSDAVYRAWNMAFLSRSLSVTNGAAASLAAGAPVFALDSGSGAQYGPARISVGGFSMQGPRRAALVVSGPPGRWFGEFDARGWGGAAAGGLASGPGYDPRRLAVLAPA